MTEPTGELFANARKQREVMIARAAVEAEEQRLAAEKKVVQDRIESEKRIAEKEISDERAGAFIKLMLKHVDIVPLQKFYKAIRPPMEDRISKEIIDPNQFVVAEGWMIMPRHTTPNSEKFVGDRIHIGIGLATEGKVYDITIPYYYKTGSSFRPEPIKYFFESDKIGVSGETSRNAPFYSDEGLALLADFIAKSGVPIPPEEGNIELAE